MYYFKNMHSKSLKCAYIRYGNVRKHCANIRVVMKYLVLTVCRKNRVRQAE